MARLLAACEVLPEPAAGIMRAYIALAGFAGIRPEELHRLDWADVSLAESSAFIRADVSKVGEARQVPLSQNCTAWLETVSVRSGELASDTDLTQCGQRLAILSEETRVVKRG